MQPSSLPHLLNIITTFFTLVPVSAGIVRYTTAAKPLRLFLFFLIYGFFTDLFVWLLMEDARDVSYFLFIFYSMVEAVFLFLFIKEFISNVTLKKICTVTALLMIPFWVIAEFVLSGWEQPSALFDTVYQILLSILSAYVLLKMAEEKRDLEKVPVFWFMFGIFFFCFTTFFLSVFLESDLLQQIWWMHNLINLIFYIIFTIGYLTVPKRFH